MSHRNQTRRDNNVPETASNHTRPAHRDAQPSACHTQGDDDAALMRGVRERRQDAFEALYDRHAGHVYNLCRRVTGNDAVAEEAVIETFWEIWQRPDRYDASRGTVLTYLLMLARCRAIDRLRGDNSTAQRVQNAEAFEASFDAA